MVSWDENYTMLCNKFGCMEANAILRKKSDSLSCKSKFVILYFTTTPCLTLFYINMVSWVGLS